MQGEFYYEKNTMFNVNIYFNNKCFDYNFIFG